MFDIGISELGVIAVVALIVIGPERLPRVARMIGTLLGRAQRYVNDVKAEVNREIELDELKKLQTEMQDAARGFQQDMTTAGSQMQSAVHDVERSLQDGIQGATGTAGTTVPDSTVQALAEPSAAGPAGAGGAAPSEPSPLGPYAELQEPPGTPPWDPATEMTTTAAPRAAVDSTAAADPRAAGNNVPAADPRAVANTMAAPHAKPDAEPLKPAQASLFPDRTAPSP